MAQKAHHSGQGKPFVILSVALTPIPPDPRIARARRLREQHAHHCSTVQVSPSAIDSQSRHHAFDVVTASEGAESAAFVGDMHDHTITAEEMPLDEYALYANDYQVNPWGSDESEAIDEEDDRESAFRAFRRDQ